jgi:hypothetical protein
VKTRGLEVVVRLRTWVGNQWSNHPSVDLPVAAVVVAIHAILVYRYNVSNVLGLAESSQRLAIYAAGAGTTSLTAGFAGTAIAVYGSSSGKVVADLRARYGQVVRRNWRSILGWLLASAILCILAMTVDTKSSARSSEWIFEFAIVISATKFARLIFLFGLVMESADHDSRPTGITPTWNPRDADTYRHSSGVSSKPKAARGAGRAGKA